MADKAVHDPEVLRSESGCTLTLYKSKKSKTVSSVPFTGLFKFLPMQRESRKPSCTTTRRRLGLTPLTKWRSFIQLNLLQGAGQLPSSSMSWTWLVSIPGSFSEKRQTVRLVDGSFFWISEKNSPVSNLLHQHL